MYSIIDIESSGSKYKKEAITEIAIFRFDGKEIIDQFISLVNPEQSIDSFVQKLTGITDKMVKTAPKFHEIAKRIIEITENSILVGHNVSYDYGILKSSFNDLGYKFEINTIDTLPLCYQFISDQKSYSLGKLAKSLGIPLINHHRASGDALATLEIFKILLEKDTSKKIIKKFISNESEIKTSKEFELLIKNIPHKKGVFYFFDNKDKIIFIGKSKNIFTKIQKILNDKKNEYFLIQKNVSKINYELTATNLITQIKYRNELNIHNPIFNFKIISKKIKYGVFYDNSNENNLKIDKIEDSPNKNYLAIYKNSIEAKSSFRYLSKILEQKSQNLDYYLILPESFLLIDQGRTRSEKSFVLVKNNIVLGYGFYQVYKQIENIDNIISLMTPIINNVKNYQELQRNYYLGRFKTINKFNL